MSDPVEAPRRILARGNTVTGHVGACVRYDRTVLLTDTMLNDAALKDLLTKNVCCPLRTKVVVVRPAVLLPSSCSFSIPMICSCRT